MVGGAGNSAGQGGCRRYSREALQRAKSLMQLRFSGTHLAANSDPRRAAASFNFTEYPRVRVPVNTATCERRSEHDAWIRVSTMPRHGCS